MKSQSWLTQLGLFDNEQWTPMKRVKNNVNQCFCQWVPMKTMVSNRIGPITPGKFRESSWKESVWAVIKTPVDCLNRDDESATEFMVWPPKDTNVFPGWNGDDLSPEFPGFQFFGSFFVVLDFFSISTNYSHTNNIGFILYAFILQKLPVPQDISSGVCSSPFFTTYIPLISDEISPLN